VGWIAGIASIAGGLLSNRSSRSAQRGSQYQPWSTRFAGVGNADYIKGRGLVLTDGNPVLTNALSEGQMRSLGQFYDGQQNALGQDFLRGNYLNSEITSQGLFDQLMGAGQGTQYNPTNFMGGVNDGMLQGLDPNALASNYTNLLRQQALPQEQQATSNALNSLFGTGRLGTTGGALQMRELQQAQQQADIGRQVAGQQFGLQQALQAQQGYDQARANQMGLMMNQFGANQQGKMNQFGIDQGMFGRTLDMFNSGSDMTQNRFMRAMQLFGGENALNQQYLSNFTGLLGAQQSQQQTLLDMARIGAGVGQSQTAANANAAQMRNQSNQDMIAGFMNAINSWSQNKKE